MTANAPLFAAIPGTFIYSSLLAAVAVHLGWTGLRRWRSLRQPAFVRIAPEELKAKLDGGEDLAVLDVRHSLDRLASPFGVPGAIWLPPEHLESAPDTLRRRLVVFYCTCPNSASVLNMARNLRDAGISRIRPLCGGVEAWKRAGFPVEPITDFSLAQKRRAAAGE